MLGAAPAGGGCVVAEALARCSSSDRTLVPAEPGDPAERRLSRRGMSTTRTAAR